MLLKFRSTVKFSPPQNMYKYTVYTYIFILVQTGGFVFFYVKYMRFFYFF